jgi:hypothetical protein
VVLHALALLDVSDLFLGADRLRLGPLIALNYLYF